MVPPLMTLGGPATGQPLLEGATTQHKRCWEAQQRRYVRGQVLWSHDSVSLPPLQPLGGAAQVQPLPRAAGKGCNRTQTVLGGTTAQLQLNTNASVTSQMFWPSTTMNYCGQRPQKGFL